VFIYVIPAKAGIQNKNGFLSDWIPAFAGMTEPLSALALNVREPRDAE
jgi:hypothetical protein